MAERAERRVLLGGVSDERLVAPARAGDEQAFAAIVERYRVPLLRYCHRFLPPAAAEDALQQTFINAYAALSGDAARTPLALRPWLYRVAHNAALERSRAIRRRGWTGFPRGSTASSAPTRSYSGVSGCAGSSERCPRCPRSSAR